MGNILWKKVRRGELTRAEADSILAQLPLLPLTRHEALPLLAAAFDIANQTQRTVYDCLYLALAVRLAARMVTADQRFFNALATTPWAAYLCWVADVP
jgi:predicted nucleic acid-binding protein